MGMHHFYEDYTWNKGKPVGARFVKDSEPFPVTYKIITDPYHKRYSIEKYIYGSFAEVAYDSLYLDFRKLNDKEIQGWQRESMSETCNLIRNMDDRIVYFEEMEFKEGLPIVCTIRTPQKIVVAIQKMEYQKLKDSENKVFLYDAHHHLVMYKRYECDEEGQFTTLLEESWMTPSA